MANRLAKETSPYLLQHANNPVDWYPWNDEALEKAIREDKPIFLSIGYSACHWCHVMEHESFEDEKIAAYLNEHFVNIKVDREERPDLDHIYMQTVMALRGGQGGWPLSAFLTPDRHVFFGGTYWPPRERVGMPGFECVIRHVHQAFKDQREAIDQQGRQVTQWLNDSITTTTGSDASLNSSLLADAAAKLLKAFDFANGGFGSAPKFPHPMDLQLLLRLFSNQHHLNQHNAESPTDDKMREMVALNLDKMAYGGIHDHLGGGFYRYSVDAHWLIPHFEKMLYDNAQLLRLYTESYVATGNRSHLRTAEKIFDYLCRDMLDEANGFHSSEDADSEGEEGKFYVWTPEEVVELLGPESGERFCKLYDVTSAGNFEGKNNLNLKKNYQAFADQLGISKDSLQEEMRESRAKLLESRSQRIRPGKDDKILASWNALALDAISYYALHADCDRAWALADRNAEFATERMNNEAGELLHSYRHGQTKIGAFLDDYAYLINALCTRSWDLENIEPACQFADRMIEKFWDDENGGFFYTSAEQTDLIARYKDHHDGSIPSGNGMAALSLQKLAQLTGQTKYRQLAERTIRWALPFVQKSPLACGQMLLAIDYLLAERQECILLIPDENTLAPKQLRNWLGKNWSPYATFLIATEQQLAESAVIADEVLAGKKCVGAEPTLYVCTNFQCESPVVSIDSIRRRMTEISQNPLNE